MEMVLVKNGKVWCGMDCWLHCLPFLSFSTRQMANCRQGLIKCMQTSTKESLWYN